MSIDVQSSSVIDTGLTQAERDMYERRIASLQQQLDTVYKTLQDERALHMEQLRLLKQRMDAEHKDYSQQISTLLAVNSSSQTPQSSAH